MFGYNTRRSHSVALADPAGSATVPIFKAPAGGCEILSAYVVADGSNAGGTANGRAVKLVDGGTALAASGTAIVGAEIGAAVGGTSPAWTAGTVQNFTVSEGTLAEGHYLCAVYTETGTDAFKNLVVGFEYLEGVGA